MPNKKSFVTNIKVLLEQTLLKIEREHHHSTRSTVYRLSILEQVLIDEVATVLHQQVGESETEFQLRDKLKEGQIKVLKQTTRLQHY